MKDNKVKINKIYYASFNSKIGTIYVASTKKGVCKITIPVQTKKDFFSWINKQCKNHELIESASKNRQIIDELNRYFDRRLVRFHSKIHMVGTDFQKTVWQELKKIKYGKTKSYLDIAKAIGKKEAGQAIGKANGANPLPIIIPCHRVIRKDSALSGYAYGLKTKEFLLRLEGTTL